MEGLILLFRFLLVIVVLLVVLYVILPDIYGKKMEKNLNPTSLDEIEKESIDILNKSRIIRDAADQSQAQLNNINQNLKK
jgi:hypothetical protein